MINKKRKLIMGLLSLFLFILLINYLFFLIVTLNGGSKVYVDVNTKYIDKGIKYKYFDFLQPNYAYNDKVNSNKLGNYRIEYKVSDFFNTVSKKIIRDVMVVDKIKPILKLNGDDYIKINAGSIYKELGCVALDNYDEDISKNIRIISNVNLSKSGIYDVTYEVADSSSNVAKVIRKVEVVNLNYSSSLNKYGLPIMMYHFFYDKSKGETAKDANYIEVADFESQIKYLKENNYYFPTWNEIYRYLEKEISLPKKSVVITADDGNPTFFIYALPIINKYNVYATSFVVTSRIKKENLEKYRSKNVFFESHSDAMHTYSCPNGQGRLKCISDKEGLEDLKKSTDFLESHQVFAYPFGHATDRYKLIRDAGFKMAVTIKKGKVYPGDNPYYLKRVRVSRGILMKDFISKL